MNEIEAGSYEGQSLDIVGQFLTAPRAWTAGDGNARIPGSINGNEFDARFDDAVEVIYGDGDVKPVAFAHSVATMAWVLMNVRNPDNSLFDNPGLPNTGQIVVFGSPQQGWTLTDGDGIPVSQ